MSAADVSSAVCRMPTALVSVLRSPCVLLAAGVPDRRAFYKTLRSSFPLFVSSKPNSNMAVHVGCTVLRSPLIAESLVRRVALTSALGYPWSQVCVV